VASSLLLNTFLASLSQVGVRLLIIPDEVIKPLLRLAPSQFSLVHMFVLCCQKYNIPAVRGVTSKLFIYENAGMKDHHAFGRPGDNWI
jgi:hypothetical protein